MKSKQSHIHQLQKINIGSLKKYYVYKCLNCSHYITFNSLALGAKTRCNECKRDMQIYKLVSKPVCKDCSDTSDRYDREILEFLERLAESAK